MTTEGGDFADTYALIYSFLAERSHFKAAEAVKKAAKGSIVITGSQDGPSLPLIVKQWRKFTTDQGKKAASPIKSARLESSGSDTSSDSSEDSESSSEESSASGTDSEVNLQSSKGRTRPKTEAISSEKVSDPGSDGGTSSDSDSDSEPDNPPREGVKKAAPVLTQELTRTGKSLGSTSLKRTDSSNSSSNAFKPLSDEGDDRSEAQSMSSDGSSSIPRPDPGSDNISISGEGSGQGSGKLRREELMNMAGSPTLSFSQNLDGTAVASKKRRTDEGGSSIVTSVVHQHSVSDLRQGWNGRNRSRKTNTPFSRVKVGEIKFADERLKDNAFGSRMAASNDYGAKANADLVVTRGASFRKEKNKKKRGSYRGGEITMESHSIKFAN